MQSSLIFTRILQNLDRLEVLGGLDGADVSGLDVVDQVLDGVVGSGDGQGVFHEAAHTLIGALVEFVVNLTNQIGIFLLNS